MKAIKIDGGREAARLAEEYDDTLMKFAASAYAEIEYVSPEGFAARVPEGYDFSALDAGIRRAIEREYRAQRAVSVRKILRKTVTAAALMLLALLMISAVMFATVERFRTGVLNFIIAKRQEYSLYRLGPESPGPPRPLAEAAGGNDYSYYPGWAPQGYSLKQDEADGEGRFTRFSNASGQSICLTQFPDGKAPDMGAVGELSGQVEIGEFTAGMYEKDGLYSLIWSDGVTGALATGENPDELIKFAENLKKVYGSTLMSPPPTPLPSFPTPKEVHSNDYPYSPGWLPEGYTLVLDEVSIGTRTTQYINEANQTLCLFQFSEGNLQVDTEDAIHKSITMHGFTADMYIKENRNSIIWTDGRTGILVTGHNLDYVKIFAKNLKKF